MVKTMAHATLKSGENMEILHVIAPEPDWTERILTFLQHKGPVWLDPMRVALDSGLDDLFMSDYLGVLDSGEVVGNISTFECAGVGILGHVFTPEEHRRKGICSFIINVLRDDFIARGGRAMYLGTGYDTHPYHIYETIGFVGRGDSGKMTWRVEPDFDAKWFAPGPAEIRDTRWGDWPLLEALYAVEGQWQLKSFYFQQFGHTGFESQYLRLRLDMLEGNVPSTRVMQTAGGAVVGHAMLAVQPLWKGKALVLDFMIHVNFHDQASELLAAIGIPAGAKVQAFCDSRAESRMAILEAAGFQREGVFVRQMEDENHEVLDVVVYGKVA